MFTFFHITPFMHSSGQRTRVAITRPFFKTNVGVLHQARGVGEGSSFFVA